ncbi:glycosyltransferase family 1 protein [Candidatus Uhrbacteria bacterium]|nr:MAG: glycosyltransferase family 1 protein [Candidatus Uhrbacteria bacterium]
MIRLGIDLRHVPTDGTAGAGVPHASRELADAFREHAGGYGMETIGFRGRMRSWELATRCRRERLDVLFAASGAVAPFLPVPAFPWVHDVAIFRHPEWFPQSSIKRLVTTRLFLRGVRNAPHVFAVSEDTKRTLVEVAGIDPQRVTVTYQGVEASSADPETRYDEYALIVGTIEPRKNIPFIIELWDDVQRALAADVKLVIAGRTGWGNVEIPKRDWIIRVDHPDDEARDRLYAGARVLLMPSLYEGFGRMALEAMSAGVPVIASSRGAIPEVIGDAGVLLDPTDRFSWIREIVHGFEGRLDGKRGMARASNFSWEKTARIILAKVKEYC